MATYSASKVLWLLTAVVGCSLDSAGLYRPEVRDSTFVVGDGGGVEVDADHETMDGGADVDGEARDGGVDSGARDAGMPDVGLVDGGRPLMDIIVRFPGAGDTPSPIGGFELQSTAHVITGARAVEPGPYNRVDVELLVAWNGLRCGHVANVRIEANSHVVTVPVDSASPSSVYASPLFVTGAVGSSMVLRATLAEDVPVGCGSLTLGEGRVTMYRPR